MTTNETAAFLRRYNAWRRGNLEDATQPDPREVGEAIDAAIEALEEAEEQARIIGMSGERELRNLARIAELEKERDALRAELDALTSMYVHHMDVIAEQADMEELGDFGEYVRTEYRDNPPRKVASPTPSVPDERAAFEAWQREGGWKRPEDDGEWDAWQARAKLAAAPEVK